MVNVVFRIFPLDLMMISVHFQVKKKLSFELQKVAVGLSAYPPLRRIWQSISISALSVAGAFGQAKCKIGAKLNFTYSR